MNSVILYEYERQYFRPYKDVFYLTSGHEGVSSVVWIPPLPDASSLLCRYGCNRFSSIAGSTRLSVKNGCSFLFLRLVTRFDRFAQCFDKCARAHSVE